MDHQAHFISRDVSIQGHMGRLMSLESLEKQFYAFFMFYNANLQHF